MDFGVRRWAIEFKLTTDPQPQDLARLNRAADLIEAEHRFLVSQVGETVAAGTRVSCNLPWLLGHIETTFA